jgi:mRNA interferase MazF
VLSEIAQGEVWWASLPEPSGSGPGYRRPVVVVQGDHLNRSRLATVVCVPLTSNLAWADAPGNVLLETRATGLPKDSVANASQIVAVDRAFLTERCGRLTPRNLRLVLTGIDIVLGR